MNQLIFILAAYAFMVALWGLYLTIKAQLPGKYQEWKFHEGNRTVIDIYFRGYPPFKKGDVVCYNGLSYPFGDCLKFTISECFESKGPSGWFWWVYLEEIPCSKPARAFQLYKV